MPNSEDYLDGLLNSINQQKSDVEKSQLEEEESIKAKIADMSSIDPNDDFMDATGISGFKAKKMSHKNLREAFSESDFLRDFENELSSGTADDFIEAFEQEIDEEEARFQRGEEVPDDAGSEFIRSLMEEDGVSEDDIPEGDVSADDASADDVPTGDAPLEDITLEDNSAGEEDIDKAALESDDLESKLPDIDENDPIATFDAITSEIGEDGTVDTDVADTDESEAEDASPEETSEDSSLDGTSKEDVSEVDEPKAEEDTPEEASEEAASEESEETSEESEDTSEEVDTSAEDAEELLAALGEVSSDTEGDSGEEAKEPEAGLEASDANEESDTSAEDIANSQELLDILDEVESIVGDDDTSSDDDSILSKEYQSDEHDAADAIEVNEEGVSLVDENADLESLLEGEEGMSDIGDLLNADENDIELDEARDAFEESANEAEKSSESSSEEEAKGEKVSLIDKIKGIFKKKKKDEGDVEEEKDVLNVAASNEVEDTTEENKKILEEMDEEEAEELAKKQAKAEAKAEKKAAKKAAKEEKKAAKAAAKAEKAKQEKKPSKLALFFKEDKSNKVPIKVIVVFVLLVGTIVAVIIIGSNIFSKNSAISEAKRLYSQGNYIEAYNSLSGIDGLNEEEKEILSKARLLADLQNKKKEYDTFMAKKDYQNAFDALVVGVGRYDENYESAKELGITAEYDAVEAMIEGQLKDQFGVSKNDAFKLYEIKGREKYTVALNEKLKALGMSTNGSNN